MLGLLAILAPVEVNDPVVSWPQAGQSPTSTVLPLSPYRPLQLDATVPCRTLQSLANQPTGEALRTLPADAPAGVDQGLLFSVSSGNVRVVASGATVLDEALPTGDCRYQVVADAGGVRVLRNGVQVAAQPELLVPQVAELVTDAQGSANTAGLAVRLHTDDRYNSSPSPLKIVLLIAHALSLLVLLTVAWRWWGGRRRDRGLSWPRPAWPDALVVVVSVTWIFLGPVNIDDSWYVLMARNGGASGYIGNYVYMFNATENPFVLSQYLAQFWGSLGGWGLLWMRLLPLIYGLLGYFLLRVLLATMLRKLLVHASSLRRRLPWAVALAHLLWWLPYGITLRPEPLIVLGSTVVLLLCELARQRRSLGVLATATAAAAVTLMVSPTALVAAAPLLINLPWVWTWLRAAPWPHRVGAVLLALAAPSLAVPIAFSDASLGDVVEATKVHTYYYFTYPWYQEFAHYETLMGGTGPWLARLPVLLTIAVLLATITATGIRRGAAGPLHKMLLAYGLITLLTLAALAPTPSKWVNHFGAIAAPASVLLALAMIRTPVPARARMPAKLIALGLVIGAASLSFGGSNGWRPFSDWGQLFNPGVRITTATQLWSTAPRFGPLEVRNPLLWLAIAGVALLWVRRRRSRQGLTADRAVLTAAALVGVLLGLSVFIVAPVRQFPGPSVATMNISSAVGRGCGLEPHVQVANDGRLQDATDLLEGHPVFVDQVSAALWPCTDIVHLQNGIAQAPDYRIRVGDALEGAVTENAYGPLAGGAFAAISRTARFVELPSQLNPDGGVPLLPWGHVEQVVYAYPVGLVDVSAGTVQRSGWKRLPTLALQAYAGRDPLQ